MLSSCWFLIRGGRKEGKVYPKKSLAIAAWLFDEETRLRLEGLCSVSPLVVLQEAEGMTLLRPQTTHQATMA